MKSTQFNSLIQGSQTKPAPIINSLGFIGIIHTNPIRLCTLVAPSKIVLATHYQAENPIPPGTLVTFSPDDQTTVSATIKSLGAYADIQLGQLDHALSVIPVQIAMITDIAPHNQFFAVGIMNVLAANATPVISPATYMSTISGYAKFQQTALSTIENGDSGAPDLVLVNGVYKVIGPHYSNQGPNSFWLTSILSKSIAALNAISN